MCDGEGGYAPCLPRALWRGATLPSVRLAVKQCLSPEDLSKGDMSGRVVIREEDSFEFMGAVEGSLFVFS